MKSRLAPADWLERSLLLQVRVEFLNRRWMKIYMSQSLRKT